MQVLRNAELPVSRWPNGAGRKADVVTGDGWMTGFAWLDADAPFSLLTGLDRTITLVEGPGFTLDVDQQPLAVMSKFTPAAFDGGAVTQCRIAGASRVFNVMTDRTRFRHAVAIVDRSGRVDPAGSVTCVVVVLEGEATVSENAALGRLDAVRLEAPGELVLSPGGRAAVVTISDRSIA